MKRQTKILWIPLAVFIAVGCILAPLAIRALIPSMKYCQDVGKWGALDTSISIELNQYYDKNGKYPDSLEGLPLVFEDGATPDMLNQIQYETKGTSCKYSYFRHAGKWDTSIMTEVAIEFSNGKRQSYTAITPSK